MRNNLLGLLSLFIIFGVQIMAEAGTPRTQSPTTDTALANYLRSLENHLNTLECLTANPDGTANPPGVLGGKGDLKCATYGGTNYICMNTSTGPQKGTAWTCVSASGGIISGTGADTQVTFWTGASTVSGESSLLWDYTNDLLTIDPVNTTSVTAEETAFTSASQTIALSSGATIANMRQNQFLAPILNGVSGGATETVTTAATVYIDGAPNNEANPGSDITLTNSYALLVGGGFTGDVSRLNTHLIIGQTGGIISAKTDAIVLSVPNESGTNGLAGLLITPENGGPHFIGRRIGLNTQSPSALMDIRTSSGATYLDILMTGQQILFGSETDEDIVNISYNNATGGAPPAGPGLLLQMDTSVGSTGSFAFIDDEGGSGRTIEDPSFVVGKGSVGGVVGSTMILASGTTLTNQRQNMFIAPDIDGIAGGATETITNAATVYIDAAPSGSDITFTNGPYALWVDAGAVRFDGGIISTGKTTTYNNISTISNGIPSELATIDTTGLTANVGVSTLYAVPSTGSGMYRISSYVVETTSGSISSTLPNVQIVYNDVDTAGSITIDATPILGIAGIGQTGALTANTVGTVSAGVIVINVTASTTIQYQTVNYASNLAGMAYALHLKLEAL